MPNFASIVRSGRAVIDPVVKGTFERGTDQFTSATSKEGTLWRDHSVAYYKDLARTLDYLETRADCSRRCATNRRFPIRGARGATAGR